MSSRLSHPRHYVVSRPYARTMKQIGEDSYTAKKILTELGVPVDELAFMKAISLTFAKSIIELEKEGKLEGQQEELWKLQEPQDSQIYSMFCRNGRMIFDFAEGLIEAFSRSDLGDALVADIKLPFNAFYMKLNFLSPVILFNNRPVDGAYIWEGKNANFIGVLLVTGEGEEWPDFLDLGMSATDLGMSATFKTNDRSLSLLQALENTYLEKSQQLKSSDLLASEELGINVSEIKAPQQEFFEKSHETIKGLLNIIANALLYLSIYPEEVDSKWPDKASSAFIKKAESSKAKVRRKAHDELWELGFSKVRYCKSPEKLNVVKKGSVDTSLAKHWRRGHWRNQPHGEGRKLRKLVWIQPCLVGKVEKPIRGRNYQVEDKG